MMCFCHKMMLLAAAVLCVLMLQAAAYAEGEKKDEAPAGPTGAALGGVEAENTGGFQGQIIWMNRTPARRVIVMRGDDRCAAFWRDREDRPLEEHQWVWGAEVDDDGEKRATVQNVLVHVTRGPALARRHDPPADKAVLDQEGCLYLPHIIAMQAGQTLLIKNSDNTAHNIRYASKDNGSMNRSMNVKGMELEIVMRNAELGIKFGCDVHPWMNAVIHVVDHPFFAVTDDHGRFKIRGLPPGEYQVQCWHENERFITLEQTYTVKVEADKTVPMDIRMNVRPAQR